jgi:hypothetical protein
LNNSFSLRIKKPQVSHSRNDRVVECPAFFADFFTKSVASGTGDGLVKMRCLYYRSRGWDALVKMCPMALSGAAGKRLDHAMEEFLKKREGKRDNSHLQ